MAGLDDTVSIRVEMETSGVQVAGAEIQRSLAGLASQAKALSLDLKNAGLAIGPSFQNLDKQIKALGDRYTDTGLIGQRSIAALGVSLRELEKQYGKNIDAAQGLSQAERQVYADARATYNDVIKRQREFNDELEKVNRATHNFTSLEGALQSLGGGIGKITTVVVGVAAAFKTGWEMGKKLDAVLQQLPGYGKSWDELAEHVFGYSQKVKEAAELSDDPRFKGTRTVQLLPQIVAKQAESKNQYNISDELTKLGVKTLADAERGLATFTHTLDLLRRQGGQSIAGFVQESKGNLESLAAAFRLAGKDIPQIITDELNKLQGAEAGVTFAKSQTQAIKAKQTIENEFTDLQSFIAGLELKFRAPDTDPITKAVQQARDTTAAAMADIGKRASGIQQAIEVNLSAFKELGAQIAQINAEPNVGPAAGAKIAALQKERAEILQRVTAERQNLDLLKSEADTVRTQLGPALEDILRKNALAEAAIKAQKEFAKLQAEIDDIAAKAKDTIQGLALPSGLADSINAQIDKAKSQAQNTVLASLFFDSSVQAQMEKFAKDNAQSHIDGLTAGAKVLGDRLHKAAEELEHATDKFAGDMADLFTAGVTGGAKGFADAASRLFLQGVNDGAKNIFKQLAATAFGATPERSQFEAGAAGDTKFADAVADSAKQQQAIMGVFSGALASIGETMRIFQQAKQGQAPSILGTTLGFAATGASIGSLFPGLGTIIGAAVGAVVGAIVGIIATAKAKAEQVFFTYGVKDGQGYVSAAPGMQKQFGNLPPSQLSDMLNQIRGELEQTKNDYIKLFGKFGVDVADGLAAEVNHINFSAAIDASKAGIKNVSQEFQYWVEHTLPADIIETFREPIGKQFETLGLSGQRFLQIWEDLVNVNPDEVAGHLMDLYDGLVAINKAITAISPEQFGITVGVLTKTREEMNKEFADQLASADVGLVQMGDTMSHLFGAEQINAIKEWGAALTQRQQAVDQFFLQVAQDIDNIIAGYQGKIRDLTLAGFKKEDGTPDIQAQVAYLKKYADTLWGQITKATTPEEVMRLSDELSTTISKIQQIGGSQSADAAEAYRKWAITQLNNAQDLVVGQLNKLAHDVAEQNAAFYDAIQGFIDAFLKATDEITQHTVDNATTPPPGPGGTATGGHIPVTPEGPPSNQAPNDPRNGENPDFYGGGGWWEPGGGGGGYGPIAFSMPPPLVDQQPQGARGIVVNGPWQTPSPTPAAASYEPPAASQSQQMVAQVADGARVSVALLQRIADNQDRIEAVLVAGRDIRVDVGGELDLIVNDEATGATVPLDAGGFDRRTIGNR